MLDSIAALGNYPQIGKLMWIPRERVRQLRYPSKSDFDSNAWWQCSMEAADRRIYNVAAVQQPEVLFFCFIVRIAIQSKQWIPSLENRPNTLLICVKWGSPW